MIKQHKKIITITTMGLLAVIAVLLYVFLWYFTTQQAITYEAFKFIVNRNLVQVVALVVAAVSISISSLIFQTVTNNRIMTPSVIGFDGIYIVVQTLVAFIFGVESILFSNALINFFINTIFMIAISFLMFKMVLKRNKNNVVLLLLVGMVVTTLSRSISSFLQVIMDPASLDQVLSRSMASVANINTPIALIASIIMLGVVMVFSFKSRQYDVMLLGEDQAINLGIHYNQEVNISMILIAISTAVATALVGPLTFLGLIAVSISRELLKKWSHKTIMLISSFVGVIALILSKVIIDAFDFGVSITTILNLVGGIYMIYLILRVNKHD